MLRYMLPCANNLTLINRNDSKGEVTSVINSSLIGESYVLMQNQVNNGIVNYVLERWHSLVNRNNAMQYA